jgi:hypothetical protein
MDARFRFLLAFLILVLGIGLSGAILSVVGLWETQGARSWHLEGKKAGQADIWGHYPSGMFGRSLAVGDVNGDGLDDLIVSAPYVSEVVGAGGEVHVIPGPLAFMEAYTMPQGAALVFQGTSGDEPQLGTYLDSGDMNGDGLDDIVMGSWTSDYAYLYLGSPDIQASSPLTIAASAETMALTLSPTGDGLVLCDFNGDGYEDLFVEELIYDTYEIEVRVWGVLGSSALTMTQPVTLTMPFDADITIQGPYLAMWGSPNHKNMGCGDIDGDGYPDLALGIYGASPPGRPDAGIVYLIRGDPGITLGSPVTLTMPEQADAIIEGTNGRAGHVSDELGSSLAIADVNGDGRADLIMGAPGASGPDELLPYAGEVYLWLGRALEGQRFRVETQASWIVYGENASDGLGWAIATGDFDNDAYPEILLGCSGCAKGGAPWWLSGQSYVLEPLQITGMVTVTAVSQLNVIPYWNARCLGEAVHAMDLNGDGIGDLVMSAPCTNYPEGNLPGTVYVVSYPVHFRVYLPLMHK